MMSEPPRKCAYCGLVTAAPSPWQKRWNRWELRCSACRRYSSVEQSEKTVKAAAFRRSEILRHPKWR